MNKVLSKGKIVGLIIGLLISGIFWAIFFPPGGSGANILLGIFVAMMFLHYCYHRLGDYFDENYFHGGFQSLAKSLGKLKRFLIESKNHLTTIKKSRRRIKKIGQSSLDAFDKAIIKASLVISTVSKEWGNSQKALEHEKMVNEALQNLELASQQVFVLKRSWRFLYGAPSLFFALFIALSLRQFIVEPYQIPSGSMIPSLLVGDHLFVKKFHYGLSTPFSSDPKSWISWRKPAVGDVVVFKAPPHVGMHAGQAWIKRVVATEGQKIAIKNNIIYIDGKPYPHTEPYNRVEYLDFYDFGGDFRWEKTSAKRTIEKTGEVEHPIHVKDFAAHPSVSPFWPPPNLYIMPGISCSDGSCLVKPGHVFVMGDNRGNSKDSRAWGALEVDRIIGKAWFIWFSVDGSSQSVEVGPFNLPSFRFDRWFSWII